MEHAEMLGCGSMGAKVSDLMVLYAESQFSS